METMGRKKPRPHRSFTREFKAEIVELCAGEPPLVGERGDPQACTLLKVSRSAYYAHRTTEPSARRRQDAELTDEIVAIHDESNGTYGTLRLRAELWAQGRRHSRKRIARLPRAAGRAGGRR
jgi:HTH-like domain